ncbi:nucleotide-sugar transporter [Parathielavia appendiculata]|uniref:Nucleotide-sugar transporter n=1 Tax=Parathielavia appendiculata TaxID=2587402 RepID=A0AAN6TYL7_9PEZI|nr:nucleotide-sugar transporter [Parathielavia appendiculata]
MRLSQASGRPWRWQLSVQRLSLALLVVQNSVLVMVMHYSRNNPTGGQPRYQASTAVMLVEVIKLLASLMLAAHDTFTSHPDAPTSTITLHLCHSIFSPDSWKLIVPAALYTLQNSLVYTAISNLDTVTFQVTYQLKILTTVLFSILLLHRSISLRQWLSLVLLTLGVALVQVSDRAIISENWLEQLASVIRGGSMPTSNASKGLMAVVGASLTSGLTCVYFEKLVKLSMASVSLWTRNVQLSLFSLFPALFIGVLWQDGSSIARDGFFAGYNPVVWLTIVLQALGGLIVAVCIAYADNVAKNFAASLSIVVSYAATALIFRTTMPLHATVGAATVIAATYLFNSRPTHRPVLPMSEDGPTSEKPKSTLRYPS